VPATFQAALIIALLVAPGYVLIQGYQKGRAYTPPDKDLYVLAQAVVASLGWLSVVALLLVVLGDPAKHWGLLPPKMRLLEEHLGPVASLVIAIEFTPFALGLAAGGTVNALQRAAWARSLLDWTGIFESPTAWDQAWMEAAYRAGMSSEHQSIDVSVRLKGGGVIEGRYGGASRADLSPRPTHQLFLETAYGFDDSETPPRLLGDGTIGGVFIDASEIAAIYFKT
jgi:hypothetical protein